MTRHIRIVTPVVPTGLTHASDFEGILGPDDILDYREIARGPASIECAFDEMLATEETVASIITAEEEGVDAVVLDCMEDPGLQPGRECVAIPVLGPCETSMNFACTLGYKFSMLSVNARMGTHFENKARLYGARAKYASTRSVEIPVLDLNAHSDLLRRRLRDQALLALSEDGADMIILGCTGMSGVAKTLQQDLAEAGWHVPVIDPIPVSVRIAKALVESGLSHSKVAYPAPKRKHAQGFEESRLEKFCE